MSHNATLVARRDVTPELSIIKVLPDTGPMSFVAGQFTRIGLLDPTANDGRVIKRAYSIGSPPQDLSGHEFCLVRVPGGKLTPLMWELKLGDRLWIDAKPNGDFTLEHIPPGQTLIMVATGTAVAPYVSMLRAIAEPVWGRFVVLHGVRTCADLGYDKDLREFAARNPSVSYIPLVSREEPPAGGLRGRVQQFFDEPNYSRYVGAPWNSDNTQVFLCGNPEMVKDLRTILTARNMTLHTRAAAGNLHIERYW